MKKALLACAVLACFSEIASAQTNVSIYGVVDLGISNDNNGGPAGSITRMDSGIQSGSRVGFKGTEDIGGGMSVNFQIENGFAADTGTLGQGGLLFGRQSWIGLGGSFGAVRLGRQMTPVYANSEVFDPFVDGMAGDSARLFNYSGSRANNVASYSYDVDGFRLQLQYGFGEVAGNTSASRTVAGYGGYRGGPVDLVLAYTGNNDVTGNVTGKTTLLGGNYNFGVIKIYGAYAWNKDIAAPSGAVTLGADTRNGLLGLTAPIGAAGTLRASYIRLWDKVKSNADAKQLAIGLTYDLSKRTNVYTSYSRTANDSAASYSAGAPGATDKLFDIGIRHKF